MFTISVPVQELADELELAQDELSKAEIEILERVAVEVIKLLEADFSVKSAGGTGAGGIRWDRDKEQSGKPIGIVTGQMQNKLTFSRQGVTAVQVLYGMPWARQFDKARTLIPDPLPQDWMDEIDELVQPIAEKIVSDVLEGR